MDLNNLFVHNGATLFITFHNGLYQVEHSGINRSVKTTRADLCHRSGKWYYEVTIKTGTEMLYMGYSAHYNRINISY